jgi:acetyl-CoA acetyltransferase
MASDCAVLFSACRTPSGSFGVFKDPAAGLCVGGGMGIAMVVERA